MEKLGNKKWIIIFTIIIVIASIVVMFGANFLNVNETDEESIENEVSDPSL